MVTNVGVLFDLEDTLIRTPWSNPQYLFEFRRRTREKLVALGVPRTLLDGIKRATIMRNKASDYIEQNVSKAKAENFRREMEEFLSYYETYSAKKSKLFIDTIPTLDRLKGLGTRMGLITNTSAKAVDSVFTIHNLKEYFDVVVTRENVRRLKPDPEGVLFALKQLGLSHFIMVGDLVLDMLAAKRAKGISVLVRRGHEQSSLQDLFGGLPEEVTEEIERTSRKTSNLCADYTVQSLAEVPTIVQIEENKI